MTNRTPVLLAPAALGNPITAWARTSEEIVVCYASGLILTFVFDRKMRRPGRRVSIHSRHAEKMAIELQRCDEEMVRLVRVDEDGNIIAVVGDIGLRIFSSNQRHQDSSIVKFDLVHQPFLCSSNFVLCSEDEVIVVKSGGYEALLVNLSTFSQVKIPISLPRQAVPILYESGRIIWVTETLDPNSKEMVSHLTISRIKTKERPQKILLLQRTVNSPIDILGQYVAYVIGKSKENIRISRIVSEDEGRPTASEVLWSCRAHRHPMVALHLWLSPLADLFLLTVSEFSCIKLWKDSRCLQVFRLASILSFSLGYPYRVSFNGTAITVVADEGLYEIITQV